MKFVVTLAALTAVALYFCDPLDARCRSCQGSACAPAEFQTGSPLATIPEVPKAAWPWTPPKPKPAPVVPVAPVPPACAPVVAPQPVVSVPNHPLAAKAVRLPALVAAVPLRLTKDVLERKPVRRLLFRRWR